MTILAGKSASSSTQDIQALRTFNLLHSKTSSLPNETLSYIFQLACPAFDTFNDDDGSFLYYTSRRVPLHLVLRLVSTLWYDIVQSTPQLWTALFFERQDRKEKHLYFKLCLEKSHQLPLNLHVAYLSPYWLAPSMAEEFMEHHAHRIQKLRLVCSPAHVQSFQAAIQKMPQLTELCLHQPTVLPKSTSVQLLRLVYARFRDLHTQPLMASITSLDLQKIAIDSSLRVLVNCCNLVAFSCHDHLPALTRYILTSSVVLDRLSTFSWSTPDQTDTLLHDQLFEHIRTPSLKRLTLGNPGPQKVELGPPTLTFISHLPVSINELQFQYMDHEVRKGFFELIDPNAAVECIRVDYCSPLFLRDIFSSLLRPTDEGKIRFPNLTRIHIGIHLGFRYRTPPPLKLWVAQQLLLLLQGRIGTIEWFAFVSETAYLTNWGEQIWDQFKQLQDAGLHLIIIEVGKVVDIESRYMKIIEAKNASLMERKTVADEKTMRLRNRTIEKS